MAEFQLHAAAGYARPTFLVKMNEYFIDFTTIRSRSGLGCMNRVYPAIGMEMRGDYGSASARALLGVGGESANAVQLQS